MAITRNISFNIPHSAPAAPRYPLLASCIRLTSTHSLPDKYIMPYTPFLPSDALGVPNRHVSPHWYVASPCICVPDLLYAFCVHISQYVPLCHTHTCTRLWYCRCPSHQPHAPWHIGGMAAIVPYCQVYWKELLTKIRALLGPPMHLFRDRVPESIYTPALPWGSRILCRAPQN